ncbi:MAG TPA: Ig-like domain repeat protein, partial [Abditibacteriaceae bacterium]
TYGSLGNINSNSGSSVTLNLLPGSISTLSGVNSKSLYFASRLNNAGTLTLKDSGYINHNNDSVTVSRIVNQSGGTFNVAGDAGFTGNVGIFDNQGTLAIGNPLKRVSFGWTFIQGSTGKLNIKIGGADAAVPQFDQLAISGSATLGGALNVSLVNGYTAPTGATFKVLTFASGSGQFSSVNSPFVGTYNTNDVTLTRDSTVPVSVQVTAPVSGASVKALSLLSAIAEDDTGVSGIGNVNLYLRRANSAGALEFWGKRGTTWGWATTSAFMPAGLSNGAWRVTNNFPTGTVLPSGTNLPAGTYYAHAVAYDKAGNLKGSTVNTFTVDLTIPTSVQVTAPVSGESVRALTLLSAIAEDDTGVSGIGNVNLYLRRANSAGALEFWGKRGTTWGWATTSAFMPAGLSNGAWRVTNNFPTGTVLPSSTNLSDGTYYAHAVAYDKAGNPKGSTVNTFTVDLTAPASVQVTAPANGESLSALSKLTARAKNNIGDSDSGDGGIGRMNLFLRRKNSAGAFEHWGQRGTTWGWATTAALLPAALASVPASETQPAYSEWRVTNNFPTGTVLPSGTNLPAGTYYAHAVAYDKAGNLKGSTVNTFTIINSGSTVTTDEGEPASSVALSSSSAQASSDTVRLVFTGGLDIAAASDPARYSVTIDGVAVAIESVQLANSSSVVLTLEEGSITVGEVALVAYDIKDNKGLALAGEAKVAVK